jgi:hypothetical protein
MMISNISMLLLTIANGITVEPPQIIEDWAVGCDNLGNCAAVNLPIDDEQVVVAAASQTIDVMVERDAAPGQTISLSISPSLFQSERPTSGKLAFAVDGRKVAVEFNAYQGTIYFDPVNSSKLIDKMRFGKKLSFMQGEELLGRTPIKGLSLALAQIERHRSSRGDKSASSHPGKSVPDEPAMLPAALIETPAPSDLAAEAMSDKELALWRTADRCAERAGSVLPQTRNARLDDFTSLVLIDSACTAYNPLSLVLLKHHGNGVRPASFGPHPFDELDDQVPHLPYARWDEERRRLIARANGRAIGDCGQYAEYAWDGRRFQMTEYRSMPVCRGSFNMLTLYSVPVRQLPPVRPPVPVTIP